MKKIGIIGMGVLSSIGTDTEVIWGKLGTEYNFDCSYDFVCNLPVSVKRRSDRFSQMYAFTMEKALESSKINLKECNLERVGTIFSSEIGPLQTNLSFCEEVSAGLPDECSPKKFSNTVSNACLGTICTQYEAKGVSTMLLGSNSVAYSVDLLKEDKADLIFTGYAEEYNEDYFKAFHQLTGMEKAKLTENAVTFLIGNSSSNKTICDIVNIKEINLGRNLLAFSDKKTSRDKELIKRCILQCIKGIKSSDIDAVMITSDENAVGKCEMQVLSECLPKTEVANKLRETIGFCVGSSLNMNILLGALSIKYGFVKAPLTDCKKDIPVSKYILVTGYDMSGNYTALLLEKRSM